MLQKEYFIDKVHLSEDGLAFKVNYLVTAEELKLTDSGPANLYYGKTKVSAVFPLGYQPLTPALEKVMKQLQIHLVLLSEYVDYKQLPGFVPGFEPEPEEADLLPPRAPSYNGDYFALLEQDPFGLFKASGFVISGKQRDVVQLTGYRSTRSGWLPIITKPIPFENWDAYQYVFADELRSDLEEAIGHVEKYLDERAAATPFQFNIDFNAK